MICQIDGCDGQVMWVIAREVGRVGYLAWVCTKCRDEMIATMGWRYESAFPPPL